MINIHGIVQPSPLSNSKTFSSFPLKKTPYPLTSHSLPSYILATFKICFLSLRIFPVLDISCKWNYTIHGSWPLASFTEYCLFKVHPCCRLYPYFPFFMVEKGFHCVDMSHFTHSSADGHLGCFHSSAVMNNVAINIHVHVFV